MVTYTSAVLIAILIQVVISILIIRRSLLMTKGVPYSGPRLVVLPALVVVLWVATELESLLLTPWALPYLIVLDLAVLVLSAFAFSGVARRMTEVYRGPTGVWSYRIGFSLAALFVGLFVVRLVIAVLLFPSSLNFGPSPGGYPPAGQQLVLAAIDVLYSVSVGMLLARSIGIQRKWKEARAAGGIVLTVSPGP